MLANSMVYWVLEVCSTLRHFYKGTPLCGRKNAFFDEKQSMEIRVLSGQKTCFFKIQKKFEEPKKLKKKLIKFIKKHINSQFVGFCQTRKQKPINHWVFRKI